LLHKGLAHKGEEHQNEMIKMKMQAVKSQNHEVATDAGWSLRHLFMTGGHRSKIIFT
jgi:beta-N-acetylglucosaminidase